MKNKLHNTYIKHTLKQIHLRSQLAFGKTLTQGDLAQLAGTTLRSFGDWMRGDTNPAGMSAILELLSHLPDDDSLAILREWKSHSSNKTHNELSLSQPSSRKTAKLKTNVIRSHNG